MLGAVVDDAVLEGDVVPLMEDAAGLSAGDLEASHHVVVGVEMDGVGPAREHGARPRGAALADQGDLRRGRTAAGEIDVTGVCHPALDLDDVAGSELGRHRLQGGERLARADLVLGGFRGLRESKNGNQTTDEGSYDERRISHQVSP